MSGPWDEYASKKPAAAAPWEEYATQAAPIEQDSFGKQALQVGKNALGGVLRGAGSIGATLAWPFDKMGVTGMTNDERRQRLDENARNILGADTDSIVYKGAKLGGEIAGTAGAGGALAKPLQALAASRYGAGIEPILNAGAQALQTGGFRVGELAGTSAALPMRIAAGSAVGGVSAGMVNPDDAGIGAAIGGALPAAAQVAGATGRAVGKAFAGKGVSPEVAALAKRAEELGISVPADRLVNSRPLNAVAAGLNYVPFSGRAATEDAMNAQLNRAVARTFGQDSPNVTMALRKAESELGGKFDDVLRNNTVKVDQQFFQELADIGNTASKELGQDSLKAISGQIDEIIAKGANGQIDGQAAYNIKRTLDRIGKRTGPEAFHALELKRSLMGALDRSIGPKEAAAFAKTREQYSNMLALEKLAKNGAEGEISAARLANMQNINNQPLQEVADIAAQFVKPREGQHGAAQRALVGMGAGYLGGIPGLVAGSAVGRGTNMLLNSDSMRRGLLGLPVAAEQEMGLLGTGLYRTAPLLSAQ